MVVLNDFRGRFDDRGSCEEAGVIPVCDESSHKAGGPNVCVFLLKTKRMRDVMGGDLSQR